MPHDPEIKTDWRYRPGRQVSTNVHRALAARRARFAATWRQDPAREAALVLLAVTVLIALFVVGAAAKNRHFSSTGLGPDATWWMESAQRYRYIEMVAGGDEIPALDTRMQAPDGYPPRSDTILQEEFYGRLAQRLRGEERSLPSFLRLLTRLVSSSAVFPVALFCFAITRRRDAALLGAAAFLLCLPVAERGTGAVLFREDLAFPVLCWHLAFLGFWVRRPRWFSALLAGVALAASLLLWKVISFYVLVLVALLGSAHWLGRASPRVLLPGTILLLGPSALAALLPFNLQHDGWLTGTPLLAGLAVAVGMAAHAVRKDSSPWIGAVVAALAFGALRFALPSEAGYDHAWETIFARLRFLGHKPEDPSLLSFHARHYWTGNYESPDLRRLARDWPLLALLALPGLFAVLRWWRPRFWRSWEEPRLPPRIPTRLLEGWGPMEPLLALASHAVLFLSLGFVGIYLVFRKLQLFAALGLALLVALGFSVDAKRLRGFGRGVLAAGVLAVAVHGFVPLPGLERLWTRAAEIDREGWSPVSVFSGRSFNGLANELPTRVGVDEPVLASFIISPFILAYLDRPTVLHCFFEGDVLERYEAVTKARFGDEEGLWQVARSYGARWYVHEAQHVLRTDPRMSQRYVADAMDWPHASVSVAMSYAPEELRHFELVWQNDWFRLFRVLDEGERRKRPPADSELAAAWNRPLFTALFGDPLAPLEARPDRSPADLLYSTLRAERSLMAAIGADELGDSLTPWSERELQVALHYAPWMWKAEQILARYYRARGPAEKARLHETRSGQIRSALQGRRAFPEGMEPGHVPLIGSP